MIEAAVVVYVLAALAGVVLLTVADAALGRGDSRHLGRVVAVNLIFGASAALAGAAVLIAYLAREDGRGVPGLGTAVLWAGAAAALYQLRGFLYSQFELAFGSPTRMRLLAVTVACAAPAAAMYTLATARYGI